MRRTFHFDGTIPWVSTQAPTIRPFATMMGPAFVAAIAYVDPGNVAANVSAGARFGFLLVWVIIVANLMACLVQYLSAKLGIVSGITLPEAVGMRLSTPARLAFWGQAELIAIATDLAEVVGGAIALHILFGLPALVGGVITGAVSLVLLLSKDRGGQRSFEFVVVGLLAIITVGFLAGLVLSPPPITDVMGGLIPGFSGTQSLMIAAAMLGATVMPHAVYLHSGLAKDRFGPVPRSQHRRLLSITRWDVGIAMVIAGSVNLAMLLVAAQNLQGLHDVDTIEGAHQAVSEHLGTFAGLCLAVGLLASGLASSSVGAYAGEMIMQGLLRKKIPLWTRRIITLFPALFVIAAGIDLTQVLLISQVVLSFGIPFALIPLVALTSDKSLMGDQANTRVTRYIGGLIAGVISVLNVALIWLTVRGS